MLSIIVAYTDKDRVIGLNGELPWKLPEDLNFFRQTTINHTIIMGRKTFESLPKVLPGRKHIVLTRDKSYTVDDEMVEVEHNLDKVFKKLKYDKDEHFVIGGAEIYDYAIKYANKIYATVLYEKFDGDAHFPEVSDKYWIRDTASDIHVSKTGIVYSFLTYRRK